MSYVMYGIETEISCNPITAVILVLLVLYYFLSMQKIWIMYVAPFLYARSIDCTTIPNEQNQDTWNI